MKHWIYIILVLVSATCLASEPAIWIDVRTEAEYEAGHLPGARNIDFEKIGQKIGLITDDKSAPIYLYCKSGRRSGFAKQTLEQLGYSNVRNAGGVGDVLREAQTRPATGRDCVIREC